MVDWREKALEAFPELSEEIDEVVSPMGLWIELWSAFVAAYERDPIDNGLVDRIYAFAEWCSRQEQVDDAQFDLPTCVAVCFYEHLPTLPAARAELPKRWSRDMVEQMRGILSYNLGPDEWEPFLKLFADEVRFSRRQLRKQTKQDRNPA